MKSLVYIISCCCLLFFSCKSNNSNTAKKKILFIGNSLTYYHEMPRLLQKMFDEKSLPFKVDQITYPGYSLNGHINNMIIGNPQNKEKIYTRPRKEGEVSPTIQNLQENEYDYVILQPRSGTIIIPKFRDDEILKSFQTFQEVIDTSKTKLLLFENFPLNDPYPRRSCKRTDRAYGKACSIEINSLDIEMTEIKNAIDTLDIPFVPVGENYYKIRKSIPDLNLYEDNIHPNEVGAFLSALTFYDYFSNLDPSDLKFNGEVSNLVAQQLKAHF